MSNCDLRGELARTKLRLEVLRAGITKLNGEIAQLRVEAGVYEGKASMLARVTKLLHDAVPYADDYYIDDEKRESTNDKSTH